MCNENNCNCFDDILKTIIKLQKQGQCSDVCDSTCDRPFLGTTPAICQFNTRPISFYTCPNAIAWTMPYTLNDTTGSSTVFRAETLDGCCLTCRVLAPNPDTSSQNPYVATNNFFTINLNCVGSLRCLEDTYIAYI